MKKSDLTTAITAAILSTISSPLVPVRDLHAAEIFTRITDGPGSEGESSTGGAWGDFNGDGFIDLFVCQRGVTGVGPASQLFYLNNRDRTFSRETSGSIAEVMRQGGGAVWGDYNNDGHLDLVLTSFNESNYLFRNNGDGTFTHNPIPSFVSDIAPSRSVTWVDFDNDGYLDLFRVIGVSGELNHPRRLYRNNRDGTFTRIVSGFLSDQGGFFSAAWGDYNNDGRTDLFMPQANEPSQFPNYFYRNEGGGSFTRTGVGTLNGTFNSDAAAWGDYDNDGDLDLFVSCAWPPGPARGRPNLLYRNNGDGTFTGVSTLPAADPEYDGGTSTGCKWADYD